MAREKAETHTAQEAHNEKPQKGGLFDDLSATQVIAGALAAVTSMLLASKIGIAGSVIGVAVGSIVSAVASQLYKKFLAASAEKLKDLHPVEIGAGTTLLNGLRNEPSPDGREELSVAAALRESEPSANEKREAVSAEAIAENESEEQPPTRLDQVETMPVAGKTAVLPLIPRQSNTPSIDDAALQGDATVIRAKELREHKKQLQRRVAAVAVASALVAVAVSAFLVNAFTGGEGIGAKVSPLPSVYPQSQPSDDAASSGSSSDASKSGSDSDKGKTDASSGDADKDKGSDQSGSESPSDGKTDGSTDPSNPTDGSGQGSNDGSNSGSTGGTTGGDGSQGSGSDQGSGSGSNTGSGTGSGSDTGSGSGSGTGSQGSGSNSGSGSGSSQSSGSKAAS